MKHINLHFIFLVKYASCLVSVLRRFPTPLLRLVHHDQYGPLSTVSTEKLKAQMKTNEESQSRRSNRGGGFQTNRQNNNKISKRGDVTANRGTDLSKKQHEQTLVDNKKDHKDDTTIFPPLDANVLKTMVKSTPALFSESGELPYEIYDRLNQIYGFPNFNYESTQPTRSSVNPDADKKDKELDENPLDFLVSLQSSTSTRKSELSNMLSERSHVLDCLRKLPPFSQFRVLHVDPLVLVIDDFFSNEECDRYISISKGELSDILKENNQNVLESRSPTVGKDLYAKAQRTSTTYYHHYGSVYELMSKATRLLGLRTIHQWEEPQTVRYRVNEKFTWHLDALDPNGLGVNLKTEHSANSSATLNAGQRIATLLVYLTDLKSENGGATIFRDLRGVEVDASAMDVDNKISNNKNYLRVQPKKGMALLFFPAAGNIANTPYDMRTIHCGEMVKSKSSTASPNEEKWIAQLWLRAGKYVPTAPPGNQHDCAMQAIENYCNLHVS